jgi:hypothetical protein
VLVYDTLNIADYIALNGKMIDEFERKQSCPIEAIISEFAWIE